MEKDYLKAEALEIILWHADCELYFDRLVINGIEYEISEDEFEILRKVLKVKI